MASCFGRRKAVNSGNPGDRVFALPYFDDGLIYKKTVLATIFRFDDVVDPEILRRALARLVCLEGWSVLGARLRHRGRHGLEYLVPATFSEKRPAFLWSNVQYDTKVADHEDGKYLPHAPAAPAALANLEQISPLMRGPGIPTKVTQYLDHDIPQLGVYVVSFTDTTLVTVSWPHTFTDAMGFGDLMQAWCLLVQGREDEVRPLHNLENDFFRNFGLAPTEAYKDKKRIMSMVQLTIFGIRQMWQTVRNWGEEDRIVCMPGNTITRLHRQALEELARTRQGTEDTFVSEGDVLLAWWAKIVAKQYRPTSKRTITVGQVFSHRSFHAKELIPETHSHLGNVHFTCTAYYQVRDIYNLTLAEVALKLRHAIIRLSSREQLNALAAIYRRRKDRFGLELVYGDPTMHMVTLSNWSKARLFQLDFSAALSQKTDEKGTVANNMQLGDKLPAGSVTPLLPSFIHCHHQFTYWMAIRNNAFVTGKDADGNYWFNACIQKDGWKAVEEGIAEYGVSTSEKSIEKELPDLKFTQSLAFKWNDKDSF